MPPITTLITLATTLLLQSAPPSSTPPNNTQHKSIPTSSRYTTPFTQTPTRLFKSGFEEPVTLLPPFTFGGGDWNQHLIGSDTPAFTWPMNIWNTQGIFQVLVDSSLNPNDYLVNTLEYTTGHTGAQTRALHMTQLQKAESWTQDPYIFSDTVQESSDLYISYWMKYPTDLAARLGPDGWFAFLEWKTCCNQDRIAAYVYADLSKNLYWYVQNDNETDDAPNHQIHWEEESHTVPVPTGDWFHVEVFLHRSAGQDGRFWWTINDQLITDHRGPNKHTELFDRFMPFTLYTNAQQIDIWIDDLQIWTAPPNPQP